MGAGRRNPVNGQYGGEHTGIGKKQKKGPYSKGARVLDETNAQLSVGTQVTYNGHKKLFVKEKFSRIESGKVGQIVGYDGRSRRLVKFTGYGSDVVVSLHKDSLTLGKTQEVKQTISKQNHKSKGQKVNKTEERVRKRETRKKLREIRSDILESERNSLFDELENLCGGKGIIGFLRERGVSTDKNHLKRRERAHELYEKLSSGRFLKCVHSSKSLKNAVLKEAVKRGVDIITDKEFYDENEFVTKRIDSLNEKLNSLEEKQKSLEEEKSLEETQKHIEGLKYMMKDSLNKVQNSQKNLVEKLTNAQKERVGLITNETLSEEIKE